MKLAGIVSIALMSSVLVSGATFAQTDEAATSSATTKKTVRAEDRQTAKAIRRAFAKTKGLDATNIHVRARGGAILLDGSVPDASQIPLAQAAAQAVQGVQTVRNGLTVKEPGG